MRRGRVIGLSVLLVAIRPAPAGRAGRCLERSFVDGARATDIRRLVRSKLLPEPFVWRAAPRRFDSELGHVAKVDAVRGRHHAARHGEPLIAEIGTSPRPVASLASGSTGG